ncbi:class I SAM-dependent methyltransferase [Kitasatospora kazusensis]|uniref:Class I SAM-dependent methyltransferase n=1 Tax=Kitasatospora kazusensis TaxID=407974 RepID=A0ABP5KZ35_9ACTN
MAGEFDAHERRLWAGRAQAYRDSFAALCGYTAPALLDAAGVTEGGSEGLRVLDVGTGPGTVAAAAAGRGALVTAVDAEPGMAELAAARVPGADVRVALLPSLPFADGAFDAVVANFVVNHVEHPAAALAELLRVVRPGGRVAATVWSGSPRNAAMNVFNQALDAAGVERPVLPGVPAELNFERTPEGFAGLADEAGWKGADCREVAWTHRPDPEVWWSGVAGGVANMGMVVAGQPPAVIAQVKEHYDRLAVDLLGADGRLELPAVALLAGATRVG